MGVKYSFPSNLHLSRECVDLISKIFQANPGNRISIGGIRSHPWFMKNLPEELLDGGRAAQVRLDYSPEKYYGAQPTAVKMCGLLVDWSLLGRNVAHLGEPGPGWQMKFQRC